MSCSDTKIKKKKKTYLCKDKMLLVMVLGCIYIHILVTPLYWFRINNKKTLTERENEKHMVHESYEPKNLFESDKEEEEKHLFMQR